MMNILCANPECGAELKYLRGGRLYLMEREPFTRQESGPRFVASHVSVRRYFWLCPSCSAQYTLRRWTDHGVELSPHSRRPPIAVMPRPERQHEHEMMPGLVG
jgi:hypothetical protein